jgi:hypothetical protein
MPIIVKPIKDVNPSTDRDPIDRRSDGFDPLIPYQMIPLGETREMVVQTGDFKAEMSFTKPDISNMSNFRILSQSQPNLFPLPGPGVFVRRVALPERSVVQFTLDGRSLGVTILEGRDRPGLGAPLLKPDVNLRISVKGTVTRRVAVCYVFDRIHPDTGARQDFAGHLAEVHNVYHDQANFSIVNIDGASASTPAARTITLTGTMGKVFELTDTKLIGRVINGFESKFPGVFAQTHCVVMSIPVPLRIKKLPKNRIGGINIVMHQKTTGRKFNLLLGGTPLAKASRNQGGPRVTPVRLLRHTMAHELGHSLGLSHNPAEVAQLPQLEIGKEINPVFFQPVFHNLMFPVNFIFSDRINGAQVEILHLTPPPFRLFEF